MAYWNVGLNVNTLPVISLGVGFGEDYGIYIVVAGHRRISAPRPKRISMRALIDGVATAGKAAPYTGVFDFGQHRRSGRFRRCVSKPRWARNCSSF